MNCDTWEILKYKEEFDNIPDNARKALVQIRSEEITEKQMRENRVSLHDNRSALGKLRVSYNAMSANQRKALRKKRRK